MTESVDRFESEQLDQLFTALAKAQSEMEVASKDSNNPFFKSDYADLTSIVGASRPYLAKNGLSVIQRPMVAADKTEYLSSKLCHSSGQWIESRMPIRPSKTDVQSFGSYISYLKRYCYTALVGVVTADKIDDDGEKAMERDKTKETETDLTTAKNKVSLQQSKYTVSAPSENVVKQTSSSETPKSPENTHDQEPLSKPELKQLTDAINGRKELQSYILKTCDVKYLHLIPGKRLRGILEYIKNYKEQQ